MCSKRLIKSGVLLAVTVAAAIAAARGLAAQATTIVARFTATTVGLKPGAGEILAIDVLRWSTDEEAQKLVAAFKEKGEKQWNEALTAAPLVGYVWPKSGSLGYSVRIAQHSTIPNGFERVVLVIDRPLGSWDREAWRAIGPSAVEYPFSVIELHVARTGRGEGKASLAAKVVVDEGRKAIGLENYAVAPILLRGVKRLAEPAAARQQ